MYLNGKKFYWTVDYDHPEKNPSEDGFRLSEKILQLGYWRKHPNLHGYIVENFAEGKDDCREIWLSRENLEDIIRAIKEDRLPHTEGFFFGESYHEDIPGWSKKEVDEESIKILEKAIAWMDEKEDKVSRDVIYQASW